MATNEDVQWWITTNDDMQRWMTANDNVQQWTMANDNMQRWMGINDDVQRWMVTNDDMQRWMATNDDVWRWMADNDGNNNAHSNLTFLVVLLLIHTYFFELECFSELQYFFKLECLLKGHLLFWWTRKALKKVEDITFLCFFLLFPSKTWKITKKHKKEQKSVKKHLKVN